MKRILNSIIRVGALLVYVVSLLSCGGREVVVTPSKSSISGPLGEYFQVVDRNYKVKDGYINIEIERIENGLPDPWVDGMEVGYNDNRVEPSFVVEFLDEDGDILCKDQTDIVWNKDELVAVVALGVGETSSIPFGANVTKGLSSFKVSSTFKYHEPVKAESTTVSSSSSKKSSSASSAKWDEILDDYEKVVNNYVKVYSKAMAGDISALSSYMDLLEDAEDLADELEDAEDDMSTSQMERYAKISAKLTEAALNAL